MDPKQLREQTRAEHEATEALLPLGQAELTAEGYVRALEALRPIVASWESWAEACAPAGLGEMVRARRRTPWIEQDLDWLKEHGVEGPATMSGAGIDWEEIVRRAAGERCSAEARGIGVVQAENGDPDGWRGEPGRFRAAFLGSMYVMEGSTLGGRFLAKHVRAVLGDTYLPATTYFSGHGEHTGAMWREVTAVITEIPATWAEVTVRAARESFEAFGEALRVAFRQTEQPKEQTPTAQEASNRK